MNKSHIDVWNNCLQIIRDIIPSVSFKTWFEPIIPLKLENNVLTIQVPSPFFYEYLEEQYIDILRKTLRREIGTDAKLEYNVVLENANFSDGKPYTVRYPSRNKTDLNNKPLQVPFDVTQPSIKNPFVIPGIKKVHFDPKLNPDYNFNNYVEGECNRLARSAGIAVGTNPGGTAFNPLMIYGDSGLGKTHLAQAIGILAGYAQTAPKRRISAGSDAYLSKVSESIIGYVGTKYDPLLESYVGTKVVVEVTEGDVVYEHVGILKDYTADFFEILDVHYPNQAAVQFRGETDCSDDGHICVRREGETLYVSNSGASSLFLQRLKVGDQVKPLQAVLDKDDSLELHLPEDTAADAEIELGVKVVRHLDWIVPRAHALIRHKAERYDPDQVFDIGFVLHLGKDVPFTHSWGPVQALGGENQAHGKKRPFGQDDDIRRLSPDEVRQRMADLSRLTADLHRAGVKWVAPYICSMTIGGRPFSSESTERVMRVGME